MTPMTEDMTSTMEEAYKIRHLAILVAAGVTFAAELIINGFIVAVTVTDWMRQRPLASTDQILISLGATRFFYESISLLDIFLHNFIEIRIEYEITVDCIFAISFYAGIWLANLLSVVFCLKICNFHSVFFLRLKILILQRVSCLITACVLGSICYSSSYFFIATTGGFRNSNKTNNWERLEIEDYMFMWWNSVPFLMFFMSSILLISSLCHHVYRMRGDGAVTGQLDTYYKTIQFSAFSFLSYTFYFITHVTLWFYQGAFGDIGENFILNVFPTLHSMYLIYVTARLRNRFCKILQHGTNC